MRTTSWKQSRYTELVRICPKDKQWLKENRVKKSIAGYLEYVIKKFKEKRLF